MFILSLFLLQVLSGSHCFDVELKGKMRVGNQIIDVFKKPSEIVVEALNAIPLDISGKGDLSKVLPESVDPMVKRFMRALNDRQANWDYIVKVNEVDNRANEVFNMAKEFDNRAKEVENETKDPLKEFLNHLEKKGTKTLYNIATQIKIDLNIKKNITPIVEIVANDYTKPLQSYYEFVKKNQNETERELLYLDVVETACRLLYDEEKKLLNDIIMHETHQDQGENYQRIAHKLLKLSRKDRVDVMQYLCKTYKVCREYPAFTDYFADLITEIFILDDIKLRNIVKIITNILKKKEKVFAKITQKEDREIINGKLITFARDTYAMREVLAMARTVINHKFKTIQSGDDEFKAKTKATSIMIDIIDKALYSEDDLLAIEFDNTMQAIMGWAANKRHDIDKRLKEFARGFLRRFDHNLTENARNELQVLIKIILRGYPENDEVAARLLKSGSSYVKGEDFHPDVDILNI